MSKLMVRLLPSLARALSRHIERLQFGAINEDEFQSNCEVLLSRCHSKLLKIGIAPTRAAVAIHACVIILSRPGLRAVAADKGLPMEVLEYQALREAAGEIADTWGMPLQRAADAIARLVAKHGDPPAD